MATQPTLVGSPWVGGKSESLRADLLCSEPEKAQPSFKAKSHSDINIKTHGLV